METPPDNRRDVEAAVASLQDRLADGDPADAALRSRCEASGPGRLASHVRRHLRDSERNPKKNSSAGRPIFLRMS